MLNHEIEKYVKLPLWFIKMTSDKKSPFYLTPFERELYCCVRSLSKTQPCYANDRYFKSIFNVSIKHVNTSLNKLYNRKLINIWMENNKRYVSADFQLNDCMVLIKDKKIYLNHENGLKEFTMEEFNSLPAGEDPFTSN